MRDYESAVSVWSIFKTVTCKSMDIYSGIQAKASVDGLSADITSVQQNLSNNYSTTTQMNAAINAKASEISLLVSSATSRISSLETWKNEASLKITDSAIVSTVTGSSSYELSVNSLIEQKASSIRLKATTIAWTSAYSSMTSSGTLTCRNATIEGTIHSDNGDNEIYMRSARLDFIRGATEIGSIGTNNISGKPTTRGLVFDLEYGNNYMAFARKESSTASWYTVMLGYYPTSGMAGNEYHGWYFGDDAYMDGHMLSLDPEGRTWTVGYSNGAGIYTKDTFWIVGDSGNIAQFDKDSVILVKDTYANVVGTPSDERLKTNIVNCDTDALSLIRQLDFKSFDWIENGDHEKVGLIAQEVEKLDPSLVSENKEVKNINPTRLLWYCTKAIQELSMASEISTPKMMRTVINAPTSEMTVDEKKAWIKTIREKYAPVECDPGKMFA